VKSRCSRFEALCFRQKPLSDWKMGGKREGWVWGKRKLLVLSEELTVVGLATFLLYFHLTCMLILSNPYVGRYMLTANRNFELGALRTPRKGKIHCFLRQRIFQPSNSPPFCAWKGLYANVLGMFQFRGRQTAKSLSCLAWPACLQTDVLFIPQFVHVHVPYVQFDFEKPNRYRFPLPSTLIVYRASLSYRTGRRVSIINTFRSKTLFWLQGNSLKVSAVIFQLPFLSLYESNALVMLSHFLNCILTFKYFRLAEPLFCMLLLIGL